MQLLLDVIDAFTRAKAGGAVFQQQTEGPQFLVDTVSPAIDTELSLAPGHLRLWPAFDSNAENDQVPKWTLSTTRMKKLALCCTQVLQGPPASSLSRCFPFRGITFSSHAQARAPSSIRGVAIKRPNHDAVLRLASRGLRASRFRFSAHKPGMGGQQTGLGLGKRPKPKLMFANPRIRPWPVFDGARVPLWSNIRMNSEA